ncbi:MAG TPA: hypothetical protein DCG16_11160 [Gemmatimonadetes bacterium]|nr:hypothetical protein [Gemmatimonadota bacterium]
MALPNILIRPAATISRSITVLLWPCALCGQIQEARSAWNSERALALVGQARDLRQVTAVDSAFQAYQADAHGYVYFFFDPTDSAERTLIKIDQMALEVSWQAPRQTKQHVIGRRDVKELPTNISYHLDHLTVVLDDFGDLIRLGNGDEVEAVVHPAAPGADSIYDYHLADSLTVTLPAPTPDLRVYELEVRPKDPSTPGVIGSLFVQRGTGAIVRLSFTFTPAAYVDKSLDYIRISMDNSLWDGKYWLPYQQEIELRRELPIIEFLGGSIIRGRFQIRNYRFNPALPEDFFLGRAVTSVPEDELGGFPFESGLYDQLAAEGLDPSPQIEAIRDQAMAVLGQQYLSGLTPSRLHVPSVSSVYRYNRAEGSFVGGGTSFRLGPTWRLLSRAGYAFGWKNGQLAVDLRSSPTLDGLRVGAWWNELQNASGRFPGASSAVSTLTGLLTSRDFTDPYFTSGASVHYGWGVGTPRSLEVGAVWERNRSGTNVVNDGLDGSPPTESGAGRPVLAVDEGDDRAIEVTYAARTADRGFESSATGRIGKLADQPYASLWWATTLAREFRERGTTIEVGLRVGLSTNQAPVQTLFLLGGRHTLPGYAFRSFIGNRMALLRVEASQTVLAPWLKVHVFGVAGATGFNPSTLSGGGAGWPSQDTDGVKSSAGLGLQVGWDLLRFDGGRGLNDGGDWEFVFSVQRRFWEWL